MDRQMVFAGALPQDTDLLLTNKNTMVALGALMSMTHGTTTQVDGLACSPTVPAGLTVNVGPGSITSYQNVDATAYGSVAADTTQNIVKAGIILDTTNFSCPAPGTVGQSVVYLVQAAFSEVDGGSAVLPYYNSAKPSAPFNGPNNTGTSNNTVRQQKCVLQLKAGVAATTGSQVTPSPDAGYTGLWAITVAYSQTTINSGDIAEYPGAPFVTEKLKDKISQTTGDARYMQITQVSSWEATDTGTANTYAATLSPAPSAYTVGMRVSLKITNANTGASTVNFNSLGAKSVKKLSSSGTLVDPASGDLPAGVLVDMEYDGTVFQILSRSIPSSVTLTNIVYGTTAGGTTAYTITTTPSFSSLSAGQTIFATINAANTGAVTLNPNSIGATGVKDAFGNALASGFFVANKTYPLVYDGANFRVVSPFVPYVFGGTAGGTANAITVTPGQSLASYLTGMRVTFLAASTNTSGTVTVNISSLGAKNIKKAIAGALTTIGIGDILAGFPVDLVYDGTQFILMNPLLDSVKSIKTQSFTAGGTYTPSAGMLYCRVQGSAGGGAGGGASGANGVTAGGGGAGSHFDVILTAAQIGASQAVTIGAAGAGVSGANGGNGGATSLGTLITTNGGVGGNAAGGLGVPIAGGLGGAAGTPSPGSFPGAPGGASSPAAGGSGNVQWIQTGKGGDGPYGAGGLALVGAVGNGNAASGYGAGGSGSAGNSGSTGGAGSPGFMIITEFCNQ